MVKHIIGPSANLHVGYYTEGIHHPYLYGFCYTKFRRLNLLVLQGNDIVLRKYKIEDRRIVVECSPDDVEEVQYSVGCWQRVGGELKPYPEICYLTVKGVVILSPMLITSNTLRSLWYPTDSLNEYLAIARTRKSDVVFYDGQVVSTLRYEILPKEQIPNNLLSSLSNLTRGCLEKFWQSKIGREVFSRGKERKD